MVLRPVYPANLQLSTQIVNTQYRYAVKDHVFITQVHGVPCANRFPFPVLKLIDLYSCPAFRVEESNVKIILVTILVCSQERSVYDFHF